MNSWTMTTSDNSWTMATIDDSRISETPMEPIITIERKGDQIVRKTISPITCEHCGSILSAVTWTCVRGAFCPGATQAPPKQDKSPKTTNR